MSHRICRVTGFEIVASYLLRLAFDDGTVQAINFAPVLTGELYAPLRDMTLFTQVRIDPEVRTLVWPNGADVDPATLHDWSHYERELRERARRWEPSRSEDPWLLSRRDKRPGPLKSRAAPPLTHIQDDAIN